MIEINLLPAELRKSRKTPLLNIPKTKIFLLSLGAFALLHFTVTALVTINTKRLSALKLTWSSLSKQRRAIQELKEELSQINSKVPFIEQLVRNRILWSKKMNLLSDSMVSGVWLNELSLETELTKRKGEPLKYLVIRGSCASRAQDEPALIGKFLQNLKANSAFADDFAEIELGPIKKRIIGKTEIMDFYLSCLFKKEKAQSLVK